jgi:hypothetical protein
MSSSHEQADRRLAEGRSCAGCELEFGWCSFAGVSRSKRDRVLDSDLVAFVHSGVAIGVGTRSDDLRPAFTRGWGPEVSADGRSVAFCVIAPPRSTARENIEGNGAIAVVFNPPTAGRALQLKGVVVEVRDPGRESSGAPSGIWRRLSRRPSRSGFRRS